MAGKWFGDVLPQECVDGLAEDTYRSEVPALVTIGWNPASNPEGGEGFVVRGVQGRMV